jgi:hypothetical protein
MVKPLAGQKYEFLMGGQRVEVEITYVNMTDIFYKFVGHITTRSISFDEWNKNENDIKLVNEKTSKKP